MHLPSYKYLATILEQYHAGTQIKPQEVLIVYLGIELQHNVPVIKVSGHTHNKGFNNSYLMQCLVFR